MVSPVKPLCYAETVEIANGGSLSAGINLGGHVLSGVFVSDWTDAVLTFQASYDGTTYYDVYGVDGEVSVTVAADAYVALDPVTFYGVNFLKVRSGTTGSPVAQGDDRALVLMVGVPDRQ